jgi:hypothetical protein
MDFTKSFTYITDDSEWPVKIGILAAISTIAPFLLGIPYLFVMGYGVAISRNVKKGVENPLPNWDDFGTLFKDGLNLFIARIIYTLPFLLVLCVTAIIPLIGVIGRGGDVSEEIMAGAIFSSIGLTMCVSILFGLVYIFVAPAIVVQYVRYGTLSACLNFGAIMRFIRNQFINILLIMALIIGVGFAFSILTGMLSVIPILGTLVGMLFSLLFSAVVTAIISHLYGQLAILDQTAD